MKRVEVRLHLRIADLELREEVKKKSKATA
jgi:hypothetical protein